MPPPPAAGQTPVTFIGVALDDDARRADEALLRYLERAAGVTFVSERAQDYPVVIDRLVAWRAERGGLLARVTPYALVAAEVLGADVEVLATYTSRATGGTTYQSYLVVNRQRFPYQPELAGVLRYLREAPRPREFAYHSKFSTSSYFLPALFFRQNDIFDMAQHGEQAAAVRARQLGGGGAADLVVAVARGDYDLAAVFSGTKAAFEATRSLAPWARRVHFIPLPTTLPNDLLVVTRPFDSVTVARIRQAVGAMAPEEIGRGDFLSWRELSAAPEAREALANLRWLAQERPASATVEVRRGQAGGRQVPDAYLAAARRAVRLAGPELVNYDRDFHAEQDYLWTLEPMHDAAVVLRSRIVGSDLDDQEFQISFRDVEDLSRRIGELFRERLHRIRHVWPYRLNPPTVLRDADFTLEPGAPVRVRQVHWLNIGRNSYLKDAEFDARIASADFHKFELAPAFIAPPDRDGLGFSPMSNISYRVVFVRGAHELPIFRALTVGLLALLLGVLAAAVVELRRVARRTDFRSLT